MRQQQNHGPPMFTFAMLAVFLAFFGAQWKGFDLTRFFAYPWYVADGQLWRLLTCTIMHGGMIHLLFNTVLFLRFSAVIDNWLGPWGALLLYVLFAASSTAAQLLMGTTLMVGASGAVYGLFGFLWVLSRRRDDAASAVNIYTVETMLGWLVVCFVVNLFGGRIANTAHVWGLFVGWLLGQSWVARRKWKPLLIAATVIAIAAPIALTQRPVWARTLGHLPYFDSTYHINPSPGQRQQYDNPENQFQPGVFAKANTIAK